MTPRYINSRLFYVFSLSLLILAVSGQQGGATTTTVTVTANPQWTETPVSVNAGDILSITASGLWRHDTCCGSLYGPDGDPLIPTSDLGFMTQVPKGALIGAIAPTGNNDDYFKSLGQDNPDFFKVGSSLPFFLAPKSGKLYLGFNDYALPGNQPATNDNTGSVTAAVDARQRNAIWLDLEWNFKSNAEIETLVSFFGLHSINMVYLNIGSFTADGSAVGTDLNMDGIIQPTEEVAGYQNFIAVVKSLDPLIKIYAWVNGNTVLYDDSGNLLACSEQEKRQLRLADRGTVDNIVSLLLSKFTEFDGVHLDIEPVSSKSFHPRRTPCTSSASKRKFNVYENTTFRDFENLLQDIRAQIAPQRALSIAAPGWIEKGTLWNWETEDFAAIADAVDHLATIGYTIPDGSQFPTFKDYISTALTEIMGATAPFTRGGTVHGGVHISIGLSTEDKFTGNLTDGILGVEQVNLSTADSLRFEGISLFRYGTTDICEWYLWDINRLGLSVEKPPSCP